MTSMGGGGSAREFDPRPLAFIAAAPAALLIAALGVIAGAAAGLATCALWGLV